MIKSNIEKLYKIKEYLEDAHFELDEFGIFKQQSKKVFELSCKIEDLICDLEYLEAKRNEKI